MAEASKGEFRKSRLYIVRNKISHEIEIFMRLGEKDWMVKELSNFFVVVSVVEIQGRGASALQELLALESIDGPLKDTLRIFAEDVFKEGIVEGANAAKNPDRK